MSDRRYAFIGLLTLAVVIGVCLAGYRVMEVEVTVVNNTAVPICDVRLSLAFSPNDLSDIAAGENASCRLYAEGGPPLKVSYRSCESPSLVTDIAIHEYALWSEEIVVTIEDGDSVEVSTNGSALPATLIDVSHRRSESE